MVVHQLSSSLGVVDFTNHSLLVWDDRGSPHRRPKDILEGTDWPTGGKYLIYSTEGSHEFEGDIICLGKTAANPSRTLDDAEALANSIIAQIRAAEKYGPSGGAQGAVVNYKEEFGDSSTTKTYTVVRGEYGEPSRYPAGGYVKLHIKLVCNSV